MENTKLISFVGMERCDIPYYLASQLEKKKLRVLVIDNSFGHDLFLSLKRPDEETFYLECGHIVYARDVALSEEFFEKFDVVIVYHGFNMDEDILLASNRVVFSTDYFKTTINQIWEYIDTDWINENIPKEKILMLYRDKMNSKISEKYILNKIGLVGLEEDFIISFDESNQCLYLNYIYNGIQDMKGASSELKTVINSLKDEICGKKTGKLRKAEDDE